MDRNFLFLNLQEVVKTLVLSKETDPDTTKLKQHELPYKIDHSMFKVIDATPPPAPKPPVDVSITDIITSYV